MIVERVESDQYGVYYQECVGVMDFPLMAKTMDLDDIQAWMEKYHPKSYRGFSSWGLRLIKNGPQKDFVAQGFNVYAVMVATRRANQDWSSEGTNYQRQSGDYKPKHLPVAATDKDIEKWQASMDTLVPEWFESITTLDALKTKYESM